MKGVYLTISQVERAMINIDFIALRTSGGITGVNCSVMKTKSYKEKRKSKNGNKKTCYIGYYEIDFMEYIRIKGKFL